MSRTREVIRQVLEDFFPNGNFMEDEVDFDQTFMINSLDDEEKELLTDAIADALEKELRSESQKK